MQRCRAMNLAGYSSNAGIRKSIWQRFFGEQASMSKSKSSQRRFCELGSASLTGFCELGLSIVAGVIEF